MVMEDLIWHYFFYKQIFEEKSIEIFNKGYMMRDFTYIDDVIESLVIKENSQKTKISIKQLIPSKSYLHAGFNIAILVGSLMDYITAIEEAVGKKAMGFLNAAWRY